MTDGVQLAVIHRSHLFCQCLAYILGEKSELGVVEVDFDQEMEAIFAFFVRESPAIAIVDLSLPGDLAIDIAKFVREQVPETRLIVIVSLETQHRLADFVGAGADAWVHQESSLEELRTAVRDVLDGRTFCTSQLLPQLVSQFADVVRSTQWADRAKTANLTQRELEILELISDRMSNIRQYHFRVTGQGSRDCHSLALTSAHARAGGTAAARRQRRLFWS